MSKSFAVCSLLALAVIPSVVLGATRFSGRVVGHDGKPVSPSHVQVVRVSSGDEIALSEVAADGSFDIEAEGSGFARLRFAALWHAPQEVLVELDGSSASYDVELGHYEYDVQHNGLSIRGDMNRWRTTQGPRLQSDFGETYYALFKARTDSIRYQVMGAVPGRSVAGTDAAAFEYDGGGDYRSVVLSQNGQVAIVFDPALLPQERTDFSIDHDEDQSRWGALDEIAHEMEARADRYHGLLDAVRRSKLEPDERRLRVETEIDSWRPEVADLRTRFENEDDPVLRPGRLLAAIQLDRMTRSEGADTSLVLTAMEEIDAHAPYWSLAPEVIGFVVRHSGGYVAHQAWLDRMIDAHPDPDIRKNAMVRAIGYADEAGLDEVRDEYFTRLRTDFPEAQEINYVKRAILEGKLAPGTRIPEFAVASLEDPDIKITSSSLLGKTVLIDFWATWCKPCVAEMPELHRVYETYRERGFQILSLSLDRAEGLIQPFRDKKWPMPWRHAYLENGFEHPVAQSFAVTSIPKPILVSPTGEIVATGRSLRGNALDETIKSAIEAAEAGAKAETNGAVDDHSGHNH